MAKRILKYILMFSVFLVLQITLIPLLAVYDVYPDLLLVGVILSATRHGTVPAILTGFLVGLAQDITASQLYGLQALSKSVAGFVAGSLSANKVKFDLQITTGIVLVTALAHNLIRDGVYYIHEGYGFFPLLFRYVVPNAIYTTALAAIVQILWPGGLKRKAYEY